LGGSVPNTISSISSIMSFALSDRIGRKQVFCGSSKIFEQLPLARHSGSYLDLFGALQGQLFDHEGVGSNRKRLARVSKCKILLRVLNRI
jgi:hypothetical protein